MADSNGSQSQESAPDEGRARPYVVLQQSSLMDSIIQLFGAADVGLGPDEWDKVKAVANDTEGLVYVEVDRLPSRNGAHALTQVARRYPTGVTPPLVAVSGRMFQPRTVTVEHEPRVSLS